jgi:hypothetical protein
MQAYGTQPRQTRPGFGSLAHRTMQLVANLFPVSCKLKEVCPIYYFTDPSYWLQYCRVLSTCTLFMHMVNFHLDVNMLCALPGISLRCDNCIDPAH